MTRSTSEKSENPRLDPNFVTGPERPQFAETKKKHQSTKWVETETDKNTRRQALPIRHSSRTSPEAAGEKEEEKDGNLEGEGLKSISPPSKLIQRFTRRGYSSSSVCRQSHSATKRETERRKPRVTFFLNRSCYENLP